MNFTKSSIKHLIVLVYSMSLSASAQVFETPKIHVRYADGTVTKQTAGGTTIAFNSENTTQVFDSKETPLDATALPGGGFITGSNSTAIIAIPGAGECRMMPDTQIKLPTNSSSGHSLELLRGKLFIDISADEVKKRGESSFRLKTPVALLAVKGTQFYASSSKLMDGFGLHTGSIGVVSTASSGVTNLDQGRVLEISANSQTSREMTAEESESAQNYEWLRAWPFSVASNSFFAKGSVRIRSGKVVVFIDSCQLTGSDKLIAGIDFLLATEIPEEKRINAKWTSATDPKTGKPVVSTLHPINRAIAKGDKMFLSEIKMECDLPNDSAQDILTRYWLVIRELYSDDATVPRASWSNYPFSSSRYLDGSRRRPL